MAVPRGSIEGGHGCPVRLRREPTSWVPSGTYTAGPLGDRIHGVVMFGLELLDEAMCLATGRSDHVHHDTLNRFSTAVFRLRLGIRR